MCPFLGQTSLQSLWTLINLSHALGRGLPCLCEAVIPLAFALSHSSSPFHGETANDCLGTSWAQTLLPQENLLLLCLEVKRVLSQKQNLEQVTGFPSFWKKKQACLGDQEAGGPCCPCGIRIKKKATIRYPPKWHQGKHKQIWFPRGSLHSKGHCSLGAAPDTRPVVPDQLARPQFPGVKSQQRSLHPLGDFPLHLCCCFLMDLLCLNSKQ